jgi:hypothetical protein
VGDAAGCPSGLLLSRLANGSACAPQKLITGLTKHDGQPHLTSFDYYTYPRIIPSLKLAMHFLDLIN